MITLQNFFAQARAGTLTAIRCRACGELAIPPKEFCAGCQARSWEPVPLAGDGSVVSYTVIRVAPRMHAANVPYAVALVRLREGVSLLGRILGASVDQVTVGMRVKFEAIVTGDQTSVGFRPA